MRVVHPSVYLKQKERKRRRKPGRYIAGIVAIMAFCVYGYLAANVKAEYTVSKIYPQRVFAQELPFDWPANGSAAIGYVGSDTKVLASNGGSKKIPSASTIKLLTAAVVLNQKPLGPSEDGERIYFTNADVERMNQIIAENGAYFPITNGMSMTYRQALEASLISSANNISEKLAIWAYGGIPEYQNAAQIYLAVNRIPNTTVDDPNGLSAKTITTSDDMLKIALLALDIPVIKNIVAVQKTQINGVEIVNTNTLLRSGGIDGAKTGYTIEAGNCLVLSETIQFGNKSYILISAVFAQPNRATANAEATRLLAVLKDNISQITVTNRKDKVADVESPWGSKTVIESNGELLAFKWKAESVEAKVDIPPITASKRGEDVGKATLREEDVQLVLKEDLPGPSLWWRLTHAFDAVEQMI